MNAEEIEVRQHAKERERELERLALTRVCGICGGGLITPWVPERNRLELICSKDKTHKGFTRQDRVMERYGRIRQRILERGESTLEIDKAIVGYQIQEQKRRSKR